MRDFFKLPIMVLSAATAASFTLAACTGETTADTEIATEDTENVGIEAPGLQTQPDSNGAKSAETDQPTLGADSVSGDLGSPVAEPGLDQPGTSTVRGNQGAANE
ncbi:MAG: hypothetical protein WA985_00265 [Erythrobacter sp.]|uniref:hypothetical protein n=1 Tax=Erythrobacter sp. TaxID=1042 RepID=UPI003C728216